jgi:hypothetical protein
MLETYREGAGRRPDRGTSAWRRAALRDSPAIAGGGAGAPMKMKPSMSMRGRPGVPTGRMVIRCSPVLAKAWRNTTARGVIVLAYSLMVVT